ncbi:hypothetical protein GALMADRAFT_704386 [Galerina marginata CBS 339.88]|uniref:Uncharacterized protein n=1 Tax=Galerina marginata (strain CBS 339.88) TaxID=685588 RepID=A0A067TPJ5_GALM3|nr:hypothetical protein GALMADRAFT_704386 [Galerina marginata CBS 339.88]
MTDPRLSTVFDYSSLRLHPDGTRVYQKSSNFRPGLVKVTTQDPRSNWIARDAGGLGSVPKVKKRVKDASEGDVRAEQDGDSKTNPELSDDVDEYEGAGRKRKRKRVNKGKLKRHKFINDDSYLEPEASSSKHNEMEVSREVSISEDGLPEPSADLLKCIHRFASEFYTERGQLLNISREYRKERKDRALRRRARREKQAREDNGSPSGSPSSSESSDSDESSSQKSTKITTAIEDEEGSTSSEDSNDGDDDNDKANQDTKGKRKTKSKRRRRRRRHYADKLYTDMYKMFDGSAMMVLGANCRDA